MQANYEYKLCKEIILVVCVWGVMMDSPNSCFRKAMMTSQTRSLSNSKVPKTILCSPNLLLASFPHISSWPVTNHYTKARFVTQQMIWYDLWKYLFAFCTQNDVSFSFPIVNHVMRSQGNTPMYISCIYLLLWHG